jgi:6-phosphogluconolactonase
MLLVVNKTLRVSQTLRVLCDSHFQTPIWGKKGSIFMQSNIQHYATLQAMSRAAAEFVGQLAEESVKQRGRFTVALSGGNTPRMLYAYLAQAPYAQKIPWSQTHLFWGDERFVPANHPDSNFAMASQALIKHAPIPPQNVHRVITEHFVPEEAADMYENTLRERFEAFVSLSAEGLPAFELILLGMGKDGHTASLFPDSPVLNEKKRWVAATPVPNLVPQVRRITLTFPVINAARNVIFLVTGPEKQPIVQAILDAPEKARELYPAAKVEPRGTLYWFLMR